MKITHDQKNKRIFMNYEKTSMLDFYEFINDFIEKHDNINIVDTEINYIGDIGKDSQAPMLEFFYS